MANFTRHPPRIAWARMHPQWGQCPRHERQVCFNLEHASARAGDTPIRPLRGTLPPYTDYFAFRPNRLYTSGMITLSAQLDALAQRYHRFSAECEGISPLYAFLSAQIAQDRELLTLALACRPGQPPGNLLLGAVHFLLYQQPHHPLAAYYPSLTLEPLPREAAFPVFKQFCLDQQLALEELIATQLVQTNEIRRCTYLFLAFAYIAQHTLHQGVAEPLALLELGASAGLNLLWDHYWYLYQHNGQISEAGVANSPVRLTCVVRGQTMPGLPAALPPVAWRMGLDLNPVDLHDAKQYLWLQALIWPEHHDRMALLEDARLVYHQHPPLLRRGDIVADLAAVLAAMPAYTTPVIFHTHVFNQLTPEDQAHVSQQLGAFSRERTLYRVGNDLVKPALQHFPLTLQIYQDGQVTTHQLADVDGHGRWLQWYMA